MQFGKQLSDLDLLGEIQRATADVAETYPHVRRQSARGASSACVSSEHVDAPQLVDLAPKPPE